MTSQLCWFEQWRQKLSLFSFETMTENIGIRRQRLSFNTYGLSKPSKQSLVARGLAANEEKALKRLQGQKKENKEVKKPTYIFYNSSDSDADQVYSMNKKLNRCSSLLKKITEEDDPKTKQKMVKQQVIKERKNEKKKAVKIILPNATRKPAAPGLRKNALAQRAEVVTSTPNLKVKTKAKKLTENDLRKELSQMEIEKNLLKEQYAKLLQQSMLLPSKQQMDVGNRSCNIPGMNENAAESFAVSTNNNKSNSFGLDSSNTSNMTPSPVFKELERTITSISEKLAFPGSLTPAVDHQRTFNSDQPQSKQSLDQLHMHARYNTIQDELAVVEDSHVSKTPENVRLSSMKETSPTQPSVPPTGTNEPKYSLYSFDSLEEGTYCSSLSGGEDDKTLVSENDQDCSLDDQEGIPFIISQNEQHFELDPEECVAETDKGKTEAVVKSVRFEKASSFNSHGENTSSDCLNVEKIEKFDENNEVEGSGLTERVFEKSESHKELPKKAKIAAEHANRLASDDGKKHGQGKMTKENRTLKRETKDGKKKGENKKLNSKRENDEEKILDTKKKQFYESPNSVEDKKKLEVESQLSKIKEPKKQHPKTSIETVFDCGGGGGIKPSYAATQITALGYLFKELTNLLSDRINSEESRLLTEIDHMIGILPFLINNLNPDLQTELNLALQPLRVENSDLRRQLRIANQRIRDYEVNVEELNKSLESAKKTAIDATQLEQLRAQMNRHDAERTMFKEKIGEITKMVEELRIENQKLIEKISEKDAEVIKQKQLWQKEKTSLYSDREVSKKKLESMSLGLQAQEKENKILKLSLSQSEAEIIRIRELNRDLRDSVAKLLKDVQFQDERKLSMQNRLHEVDPNRKVTFKGSVNCHENNVNERNADRFGWNDTSNRTKSHVDDKQTYIDRMNEIKFTNIHDYSEIPKQNSWFEDGSLTSSTEQNSDVLSSSLLSNRTDRYVNENSLYGIGLNFDDQFSTLTCDSGEFRSNLADLSSNIRRMQQSLNKAKGN